MYRKVQSNEYNQGFGEGQAYNETRGAVQQLLNASPVQNFPAWSGVESLNKPLKIYIHETKYKKG